MPTIQSLLTGPDVRLPTIEHVLRKGYDICVPRHFRKLSIVNGDAQTLPEHTDVTLPMEDNIQCTHENYPWISAAPENEIVFHPSDPSRIDLTPIREPLKKYLQDITAACSAQEKYPYTTDPNKAKSVALFRDTRRRIIFRHWPRASNGDAIVKVPDNYVRDKVAANGFRLWGATLFDFYLTPRYHDQPDPSIITSGNDLMKWMKAHEETETCAKEIAWAEREEDPRILEPYDIARLLREEEGRIRSGEIGKMLTAQEAKRWGLDLNVSAFSIIQ